ncbi:hypothetical protein HanOQP8_Chr00c049g0733881 [Helianthus annuus]|nr:hypothetical protein HanOQP8_Chr00c049g0733881 [Helianthus annuus]KAJ0959575.1 hypothetical protein HanPSC8_Chr00c021g0802351 [Helianthus annuus]
MEQITPYKGRSISGPNAQSILPLPGGSGDDPNRKKVPVSKDTATAAVSLLRQLVLEILARARDPSLREGLHNPTTQAWNRAITTAIQEQSGHYSISTLGAIQGTIALAGELVFSREQSPFFLRVLQLVRERYS